MLSDISKFGGGTVDAFALLGIYAVMAKTD
jgi:hypothetical protein